MNRQIDRQLLLAGDTYQKQERYWRDIFQEGVRATLLPCEETNSIKGERLANEVSVNPPLAAKLLSLSKGGDMSVYIMTIAALAVTLHRYTGQTRVTVMSPLHRPSVSRRTLNDRVVVPAEVDETSSFAALVKTLRGVVIEGYGNQDYPYDELARRLDLPPRLADVACSMEGLHKTTWTAENEPAVHLILKREDSGLSVRVEFDSLYPDEWIRRFTDHMLTILKHCAEDPHRPLSAIPMLSPEEKAIQLNTFNHCQPPVSLENTLPDQVARIAGQWPDRVALSSAAGDMSYGWLDQISDRLANVCRQLGLGPDRLAALLMPRSSMMAVAILGVWKAGGAYIPLRLEDPPQRIAGILADACPTVILTWGSGPLHEGADQFNGGVVNLETVVAGDISAGPMNSGSGPAPESLAYVIYTSGSTGRPKGAMVEHKGMINHIDAKIADLGVTEQSVIAQNASHTFDISVWQFFTALATGGKTIVYQESAILDAGGFLELVTAHCLTILEVVPSYLAVLLEVAGAAVVKALPRSLKLLLVTGETVKPELIGQWFATFPQIPVLNAYGPTEASDDICHHLMTAPVPSKRVPVGRPLRNLIVTVLDSRHRLCPQGLKGEICVSGVGVGRGYLNDPEKTAAAFVPDPFSEDPRARMYKTGDVGRFTEDGVVDFFGRKDQQVKIRGFRIELEEIERHIAAHPAVKKNVVVDVADDAGNTFLCAFVQLEQESGVEDVKRHVAARVPDYMVPGRFERVDTFPLTPNGKIDRKRLRAKALESGDSIPFLPRQQIQEVLARRTSDPLAETVRELEREALVIQRHSEATGRQYFPLSQIQKTIYNVEKVYPGTTAEVNCGGVRYPRLLDRELLTEAIRQTIRRQPFLRSRLVEIDVSGETVPAQYIHESDDLEIYHLDFSGDKDGTQLQQWIDLQKSQPFQLIDNPLSYFVLLTLPNQHSGYLFKSHHLLFDGWSYSVILNDIDAAYSRLEGEGESPETLVPPYCQFVSDELDYLRSPRAAGDLEYWLESLEPAVAVPPLQQAYPETGIAIETFNRFLDEHLAGLVSEFTAQKNTTPYMVVMGALALCLARRYNSLDIVIGSVSHGRHKKALKHMAGVTINSIPLTIRVDPRQSFRRLVTGECYGVLFKALRHQRFPFWLLGPRVRARAGVDPRNLIQINLVDHPTLGDGAFVPWRQFPFQDSIPLNIHINPSKLRRDIGLEIAYLPQKRFFRREDIDRLHRDITGILRTALENPDQPLGDILSGLPFDMEEVEQQLLGLPQVEQALITPSLAFLKTTAPVSMQECLRVLPHWANDRSLRFIAVEEIPDPAPTARELESLLSGGANRPTDPLQIQLAALWAEVLAIDEAVITPQSDFFQCGGQSLKATVLNSKIQQRFQVNIPLARLFDAPVLAEMADLIKQVGDETVPDVAGNLVPLRQGSDNRRHLFLVHAGSGEVEHYLTLANRLDPAFHVWGLRADPIHHLTPENRTVHQLAQHYLDQIKTVCPQGPYCLGGLCIGGVIAYEMTRILESRGEEPRLLLFVDSALFPLDTVPFTFQSEMDWVKRHFFNKQIVDGLTGISELNQIWPSILEILVKLEVSPDTIRGLFPQDVGLATPDFENLDVKGLIYFYNLGRTFHNAVASYMPPTPIETPIHSFIATQSPHREVYRQRWEDHAAGGIEFDDVDGGHFTVFNPPHVDSLALKFDAALKKAANRGV